MSIFEQKARILYHRTWIQKDGGGRWSPSSHGFTFATAEKRQQYRGKPEEGVSGEAVRTWAHKHVIPDQKSLERLVFFINTFLVTKERLELNHFDDSVSVEKFCRIIGHDDPKTDGIESRNAYKEHGPQLDYVFKQPHEAQELFEDLRGKYHGFRREPADYGGNITRMGIVISAVVPIGSRCFGILCRLSIPSRDPGKNSIKYTGLVSQGLDAIMNWTFRQDERNFRDVVLLMTDKGHLGRDDFQRMGGMFTMPQDPSARPVCYDILIRRVQKNLSWVDGESFLEQAAKYNMLDDTADSYVRQLGGRFIFGESWNEHCHGQQTSFAADQRSIRKRGAIKKILKGG